MPSTRTRIAPLVATDAATVDSSRAPAPTCLRNRSEPPGTGWRQPGRPSAAYGSIDFDEWLVRIANLRHLLHPNPADIQQLQIPLTSTPIKHSRRASSLPDHHHTVHPDRSEHWAHGTYSGLVDLFLVAKPRCRAQAIAAASVARTNSRARLRSGSIWPLVSALIRIPVHFYVSRMWNQPIELTEAANMAATSS
jgi:hypothetical protein